MNPDSDKKVPDQQPNSQGQNLQFQAAQPNPIITQNYFNTAR